MKDDYEMKQKYDIALNQLNKISVKADELSKNLAALENTLKKNITIDDKMPQEDKMKDISNDVTYISRTVKGTLIPHVRRKLTE